MEWLWIVPILMGVFVAVWLWARRAKAPAGRDKNSAGDGAYFPIGADGGGRKSGADQSDMSSGDGGGDGGGGDGGGGGD